MTKFLVPALLIASLAAPAAAEPVVKTSTIIADGIEMIVTDTVDGPSRRIAGHEVKSGKKFQLDVARGQVTGFYGNTPVSYPLPVAKAPAAMVTASR